MAASYVDPAGRDAQERLDGVYSGGWHGAQSGESNPVSGNPQNEFYPNEQLGEETPRLVRAPADADAIEWSESGGTCFACTFIKKTGDLEDPFNGAEAHDAYDEMMSLIQDNYGKVSDPELVKLVHGFYEHEIRPLGYDEWTQASIARHILFHTNDEDTIMHEITKILYSQIQSLRSKTWTVVEGRCEPCNKNILMMDRLIRGLGDHLTKKKNRKA
jgi:hypothetical protein